MAKQNKEYVYVDCYQCDENGKSSPWKRKHLDDVPKWQHEEAKDFNCFATVQKYANEKKTEGEDFLAPLYFDLDYSENPAVAQEEAIKLVEFFTGELDIQEQDLHIYFSGSKGFHILVDERALGVEPRKDLQRVYKHIAGYLRYRLGEVQEQEDENGRPVEYTEPLKAVDLTTVIRGLSRAVPKWTIAGRGALVHGPQRLLSWVIPRLCLSKFLATI